MDAQHPDSGDAIMQQITQVLTPDRLQQLQNPEYLNQVASKLAMTHPAPDDAFTQQVMQHIGIPQQTAPAAPQPVPQTPPSLGSAVAGQAGAPPAPAQQQRNPFEGL